MQVLKRGLQKALELGARDAPSMEALQFRNSASKAVERTMREQISSQRDDGFVDEHVQNFLLSNYSSMKYDSVAARGSASEYTETLLAHSQSIGQSESLRSIAHFARTKALEDRDKLSLQTGLRSPGAGSSPAPAGESPSRQQAKGGKDVPEAVTAMALKLLQPIIPQAGKC